MQLKFMIKSKNKKQKNLGLLSNIKSSYCCSGTIQDFKDFKIFFQNSGACDFIKFPNPDHSQIVNAMKNAKVSGFGKHNKNVVDKQYRKAYEILPQNLGITSEFSNIIADRVCKLLVNLLSMTATQIRPQLLKLNIYEKGCFFKSHVDSPKSNSFGSLVVFLPCYYEGGELIISQGTDTTNIDFGTKQKQINWVAFFNDCVHRIEEVKAGYRLTLSYNLCYEPTELIKITPNQQMHEIISNLEKGKTYAYYCEHYYGNQTLKESTSNELSILKGKDALLWICCIGLELEAKLNMLISSEKEWQGKPGEFFAKPENITEGGKEQLQLQNIQQELPAQRIRNFGDIVWLNERKSYPQCQGVRIWKAQTQCSRQIIPQCL